MAAASGNHGLGPMQLHVPETAYRPIKYPGSIRIMEEPRIDGGQCHSQHQIPPK
jgi:hypothetical protein